MTVVSEIISMLCYSEAPSLLPHYRLVIFPNIFFRSWIIRGKITDASIKNIGIVDYRYRGIGIHYRYRGTNIGKRMTKITWLERKISKTTVLINQSLCLKIVLSPSHFVPERSGINRIQLKWHNLCWKGHSRKHVASNLGVIERPELTTRENRSRKGSEKGIKSFSPWRVQDAIEIFSPPPEGRQIEWKF